MNVGSGSDVAPPFQMHERVDPDGAVRLALIGELDLAVCDRLRSRLEHLASAGASVRLDLSELGFIDSSGLQLLISSAVEARRGGWSFEVAPEVSRPVQRVIELVGAGGVLWPSQPASPSRHRRRPLKRSADRRLRGARGTVSQR